MNEPKGDLEGRTVVVTGANAGIGRATAEALARRGARVVLCGRSAERTMPVIEALRAESPAHDLDFVPLDLASLASVKRCADRLLESEPRIDVLIANAGLAGHRDTTEDGFEIQFGVNHLGHYLLVRLLTQRLVESAPSRVVIVSSRNHRFAKRIDYEAVRRRTRTLIGLHEYNVSKLANVAFAVELAKRLEGTGVNVYSLNPGRVASDVWRRIPGPIQALMKRTMLTNEQGARTSVHCATSPEVADHTGRYYQRCREAPMNPVVRDDAFRRELWDRSERWVSAFL